MKGLNRLILVALFLLTNSIISTFGQQIDLTSTAWCSPVKTYSEFIEKDTVVLYNRETAKTSNSYFEFKKSGDFTFYTDRRLEYDSTNHLAEELISPISGTYRLKRNSLKIVFNEPSKSATTKTYVVTSKSKEELRWIVISRRPPIE